jgi:N-acetylglucosaminyl-diphospho-decaprenol L-rhamnosyltransferase
MSTKPIPPPEVTAVVPTVGRSPWLAACLAALRRQTGVRSLEIVVVDQAPRPLALPAGLADRVLRPERNLGFAGGTNLGIAAAGGEFLATVNDDAIVGEGWLAALAAALRNDPFAAAAQGINLVVASAGGDGSDLVEALTAPGGEERIDGCGLGWNRWWQAIQLGHGEPLPAGAGDRPPVGASSGDRPPVGASSGGQTPPPPGSPPVVLEVFGVSATAALFRRAALERVALGGRVFDPRLISYYEDAELAGRLRGAGFRALLIPSARAGHAGAASGRAASRERWRLVYGNRYLAAARLLGRGLWPRLPLLMLRDLLDLIRLFAPRAEARDRPERGGRAGEGRRADPGERTDPFAGGAGGRSLPSRRGLDRERLAGMVAGWGRALRHLPAFVRRGAPAAPPSEVARLSRLSLPGRPASGASPHPPDQPG